MNIDLFTLIAQVINLIILLFLLRKFLYLPVLKAVEARQKLIADEIDGAKEAKIKAEKLEAKCAAKLQEIEVERQQILAKAQDEAAVLFDKLNHDAKEQVKNAKEQWQKQLKSEQSSFEAAVQKMIAKHFNIFASKAMEQMAGAELDELILLQFKQKIMEMDEKKQKEFADAFGSKSEIQVQSSQELNAEQQNALEKFLKKYWELSNKTKIVFAVNSELICGINILAEEQLISWNIEGYLQEFRQQLNKEITRLLSRGAK